MNINTQSFKLFDMGDWTNEPIYFNSFQNNIGQNQGHSPTTPLSFNAPLDESYMKSNNPLNDNFLNLLFPEISGQNNSNFSQPPVYQEQLPDNSRTVKNSVPKLPNNNDNHYMKKKMLPIAPKLHRNTSYPAKSLQAMSTSKEIAEKRQKNTDAARRSRLKKILKMENLERRVDELNKENGRMKTRMILLESENKNYISKNEELEKRLQITETRLAEAHKVLASKLLPHTD